MHVKLEVQTQPLGQVLVKLKRKLKIALFFGSVIFVNAVIVVLAFSYLLPYLTTHSRHDPSQAILLVWAMVIAITLSLWGNVISGFMEGRKESRRRAESLLD